MTRGCSSGYRSRLQAGTPCYARACAETYAVTDGNADNNHKAPRRRWHLLRGDQRLLKSLTALQAGLHASKPLHADQQEIGYGAEGFARTRCWKSRIPGSPRKRTIVRMLRRYPEYIKIPVESGFSHTARADSSGGRLRSNRRSKAMRDANCRHRLFRAGSANRDTWPTDCRTAVVLHVTRAQIKGGAFGE